MSDSASLCAGVCMPVCVYVGSLDVCRCVCVCVRVSKCMPDPSVQSADFADRSERSGVQCANRRRNESNPLWSGKLIPEVGVF